MSSALIGAAVDVVHPWHDVAVPRERIADALPVIIEIPAGSKNKYELDKETGLLRLDRVLHSAVHYPANYGFIPRTLAEDGDPLDVLVLGQEPIDPLTIVLVRPLGLLEMIDAGKPDLKVLAVSRDDPEFAHVHELGQVSPHRLAEITRFFIDYKVLEEKPVRVIDPFRGKEDALSAIRAALDAYESSRR